MKKFPTIEEEIAFLIDSFEDQEKINLVSHIPKDSLEEFFYMMRYDGNSLISMLENDDDFKKRKRDFVKKELLKRGGS